MVRRKGLFYDAKKKAELDGVGGFGGDLDADVSAYFLKGGGEWVTRILGASAGEKA